VVQDPIGSSPVMLHKNDLAKVAPVWHDMAIRMKTDPQADRAWGWVPSPNHERERETLRCLLTARFSFWQVGAGDVGVHVRGVGERRAPRPRAPPTGAAALGHHVRALPALLRSLRWRLSQINGVCYDSFGETGDENQANFAWGTVKIGVLLVQSAWSNTLT
jgi:hypothetical protein